MYAESFTTGAASPLRVIARSPYGKTAAFSASFPTKAIGIAFYVLLFVMATVFFPAASVRSEVRCGFDHAAIDGRKIDFGTEIELIGKCVKNEGFFDMNGELVLEAAKIDECANQDKIWFYLHEEKIDPQDESENAPVKASLKSVKPGKLFKVRGFAADGKTYGRHPAFSFIVSKCEEIDPSPSTAGDFLDREAEFEGEAAPEGTLRIDEETVKIDSVETWPDEVAGKKVGVRGIVRKDESGWCIESAKWRLLELADQIGRQVSLDGRLWSMNGEWWFEYRGQRLYIIDENGRLPKSGYSMELAPEGNIRMGGQGEIYHEKNETPFIIDSDNHGRRAIVDGKLIRQRRPSLEQISTKSDRDFEDYYVVRGAKIDYRQYDDLFRPLYRTPYRFSDGFPELLAEHSFRRNILGNETTATFFYERNRPALEWIIRYWNDSADDVMAKRMNDENRHPSLRLLYAAMLAAKSDPRGRDYLLAAVKKGLDADIPPFEWESLNTQKPASDERKSLIDALYCLSVVARLVPHDAKAEFDWSWAEPVSIDIFTRKDAKGNLTAGNLAAWYSHDFEILMHFKSALARKAAVDFALSEFGIETKAFHRLCCGVALPLEDLQRLQKVAAATRDRQALLPQFLRHKSSDALRLFSKDLDDEFAYMAFRDHLSPEILEPLKPRISELSGQARIHAQMLFLLGEKDPVPSILKLLDDPNWPDKNLALYELVRLKDKRAVAPVARILRDAPNDFFASGENSEFTKTHAVRCALDAIAGVRSKEAVGELVGLLSVDLSRFGTYIDREGFRRLIAIRLIEMTGESFGLDADAWKKWHESRVNVMADAK